MLIKSKFFTVKNNKQGMLVRRECLLEGALIFVGSAYAEGVLVPRECLCGGSGYTER